MRGGRQPTHTGVPAGAAPVSAGSGLTVPPSHPPSTPYSSHVIFSRHPPPFAVGGWVLGLGVGHADPTVLKLMSSNCVQVRCMSWVDVVEVKKSIASTKFYFQRLLGSGGEQRSGGGGGGGGPGCQGDQGKKMMHHCQICNRGFLNKSNIKVHLRTHTGEKPFGCEHCSKAFRQKAHLLKHMSIHKRISRD